MYIPGLIRAATSEAGSAIEQPFRSMLEHGFGKNLSEVRLHRSKASLQAARALGTLAFVMDDHICVDPAIDPRSGIFPYVLAHEVAHLVQKQLGRSSRTKRREHDLGLRVELEANEVAGRIVAGERVSSLTPDPSREPRCWGPAGHYWTIYFISMMAGLPQSDALDNAFYAQMPDQVDELDATDEGEWYYPNFVLFVIPGDGTANRLLRRRAVQMGLHALSGWSAESETTYRTNILKTLDPKTFEFALALHPFGDSFAHRNVSTGARMYSGPAGHAVEAHASDCARAVSRGGVKAACFENAYAVDNVNRRSSLYQRYGLEMYDLLLKKWASEPVAARAKVADYLDEISDETTERNQILKIAAITAGATGLLHGDYDPDGEPCMPWKKFYPAHSLSPLLLNKALWCAEQWSGSY
jgi:Domain of unknown function (DUF4157)